MNNLQIFNNQQFGKIRIVDINSVPYFVGHDVASILGYENPRKAIRDHVDEDDKALVQLSDIQDRNEALPSHMKGSKAMIINESGVYSLVFGSKLPSAKQFKRWVTSEVLPSIRKSGGYIASKADETPDEIMARALVVAQQTIERSKQRLQMLEGENEKLQEENQLLAPKAAYTDEVLQSTSTYTLTQIAHSLGLRSVHSLTRILMEKRIIYRQSGQWQPTAKVADKGYFDTRTAKFIKSDGTIGTGMTTVITEKGRQFLHNLIDGRA